MKKIKDSIHRESESLFIGHINNSLNNLVYYEYMLVTNPKEIYKAFELKYKAHEENTSKYLVSMYLKFQMDNE